MKTLYNPHSEDVTIDVDKLGPNPEKHTLKMGEAKEFPDHVVDIMKQSIIDKMLWDNLPPNRNREEATNNLTKLIEV